MSFRGRGGGGGGYGGGRGGGGGYGRGGGGGFRGGGGRGGGRSSFGYQDMGPPEHVIELGHFEHTSQDDLVVKVSMSDVPYFNAPVYLENKEQVGKIDEIFGTLRDYFVSVKVSEGIKAKSFAKDQKGVDYEINIGNVKLDDALYLLIPINCYHFRDFFHNLPVLSRNVVVAEAEEVEEAEEVVADAVEEEDLEGVVEEEGLEGEEGVAVVSGEGVEVLDEVVVEEEDMDEAEVVVAGEDRQMVEYVMCKKTLEDSVPKTQLLQNDNSLLILLRTCIFYDKLITCFLKFV